MTTTGPRRLRSGAQGSAAGKQRTPPAPAGTGDREIGWVALADVHSAERNPKQHSLDKIVESIRRFGFTEPPLLDGRTGRLVAGHGRLKAARAMEEDGDTTPPPGIRVGPDGRWQLPVIVGWASRNDAEAEAYLVASNRLVELGGWDDEQLYDALTAVSRFDPELPAVAGFDPSDLEKLAKQIHAAALPPPARSDEPRGEAAGASRIVHTCPSCGHSWTSAE